MALISEVKAAESELEHNYVSLGRHVYTMQIKTLWLALGYTSWREYMSFLQDKFGTGRTQLYGYVGAVKTLSPYVDDKTLTDMGISKAKELKRAVEQTSKAPSEELLAKARDPKVSVPEFREATHKEFHITDHNPEGKWHDLGGVFFSEDEELEWLKAIDLAKTQDPVISVTLPKHVQFKEAILRLAREFIGTYESYNVQQGYSDYKEPEPNVNINGFNQIFEEVNSKNEQQLAD